MSDIVPADVFSKLPERYQRRAREIAARVGEIDALLVPCRVDAIRDVAGRLLGQLRFQPDADAREFASEFKRACADLPEWALSEAANDFLAGRVDNHTGQFMPTCAEFAKRARSIMTPFLSEQASLRVEASKLVERAADDHRRHIIEMERQDPAVRQRVEAIIADARLGAPKLAAPRRQGLTDDKRAALDAMRKPRPFTSKIGHTPAKREG